MRAFKTTNPEQKAYTQLKKSVKKEAKKCFSFVKKEAKKAGLDTDDFEIEGNAHQDSFYIEYKIWNGSDFETLLKIRFSTHSEKSEGWAAQNKRSNEFSFTSKYEARSHSDSAYIPNWNWAESKQAIASAVAAA